MNSLARLHRVVVLMVVGCALPWAGQMLGAGQVFGQRIDDSKLDAKRLSRNHVSEAPRGLKPAAQDIQDIVGIGSTAADRSAADRSAVARAVTGPTESLSQIIAGEVPATMIYALTPVAEHPDGAYGGGTLSYSAADISGQELTVRAGTTTYWNLQLSNWAPTGLRLRTMQAKIDSQTFDSGDGAPLELTNIPCSTNDDCLDWHGEHGARCRADGICKPAWVNVLRADGLLFDQRKQNCIASWDVQLFTADPTFFAVTMINPSPTEFCSEADKGIIYYGGTLALTVPQGAVGTYTIDFVEADTFVFDDNTHPFITEIPVAAMLPGVLHVPPPPEQNRYVGVRVPATESEQTAIEVTLVKLHHTCSATSVNPFFPCLFDLDCGGGGTCETPFTEFEGQKRYVNTVQMCRGGTEDGRGMCRSQDDCDERGLGGTCEQMHTCQGGTEPGGTACIDQAACDARMDFLTGVPRGGTCLPSITCQDSEALETTFACAVLGCQPEYRDWASELGGRTLYATGPEIMPALSKYEIALLPASCMGSEASCPETLALLTVGAPIWGSVDDKAPLNVSDIARMVDRMKEIDGSILKPAAQLRPQQVNPLNLVDTRDLTLAADALKSFPYPYKTLTPCE